MTLHVQQGLSHSLAWKLVLPIPVFAFIAVLSVWFFVPKMVENNVRQSAVLSALQTAEQFKTIRSYYTRSVVKKVLTESDLKPSYNHKNETKSIPLPVTFIHDVSELLAKSDTSINLFSMFPFPVQGKRELDVFQQQAWSFLSSTPDKRYIRQEMRAGQHVVRVAVADKMVAEACVNCHNTHPNSPKTDWKLGDVRGVLEITNIIETQLANGITLSNRIMTTTIVGALLLIFVSLLAIRNVTRPLVNMTKAMKDLAAGDHEINVPAIGRKDEIGKMASAVQIFKENAIELEESLANEKALNHLQRQFVSMASHEFRTPLSIIYGSAQLLAQKGDNITTEFLLARTGKIREAVQRMMRLMESTLTAASMQEGKISIEIGTCDVANFVSEVCESQQELSCDHVISCNVAHLPATIQVDSGSLEQVLTNLLSNAVKYAPDAPQIDVVACAEGDEVVITVRDHGLGIDEEDLPNMFQRFFRAKTSTGITGTGIGLNLVKTLVEMHGGSINVETKKGVGSTFMVRLPIAGPETVPQSDTRAA